MLTILAAILAQTQALTLFLAKSYVSPIGTGEVFGRAVKLWIKSE